MDEVYGLPVPVGPDYPFILIFKPVLSLFELFHHHQDAFKQVDRFEAGYDHRYFVGFHQRVVFAQPHHGAHMARGEKTVYSGLFVQHDGLDGGRHQHMGAEDGVILQSCFLCLNYRQRICRCRGFKTDCEKNHLPVRVFPGNSNRLQRGIHDPYVGSFCPRMQQAHPRSRYAEHIPVRTEDHAFFKGQFDGLINMTDRGYADRASRAVYHRNSLGEHLQDAMLHQSVRLPATHLHDIPRLCGHLSQLLEKVLHKFRIPVFGEMFHPFPPDFGLSPGSPLRAAGSDSGSSSSNSPICCR